MSLDSAVDLIAELRAAGIELQPAGERLRFQPKDAVTAGQRRHLAENKAELLGLLELLGPDCVVEDGDDRLHQVELRSDLGARPADDSLPRACYCCGGRDLWRLKPAGPWTCGRCHPALPAEDLIERRVVEEAGR